MKTFLPFSFATACVLALTPGASLQARTASVGYVIESIPATDVPVTRYFSPVLLAPPVFTGAAADVTSNTIAVSGEDWQPGRFTGRPHFVLILTGAQTGRTLPILANTDHALTVDINDGTAEATELTAPGFALSARDTFEIVPSDTLGSVFGNTAASALAVGGADVATADTVGLWNPASASFEPYYFNTTVGHWVKDGVALTVDYTDLALPPGVAVALTQQAGRSAAQVLFTGSVPTLAPLLKVPAGSTRYTGLSLPVDITLSQVALGPNWKKSNRSGRGDTLGLFKPAGAQWKAYRQRKDNVWVKARGNAVRAAVQIPAGSVVALTQRKDVSGAASFLTLALPYQP